jgi:hypothetical protein
VERDDEDDVTVRNGSVHADTQSLGNPFKVEWMSTIRVPFGQTSELRNRWNSNRLVKVARDSTKLDLICQF